MVEGIGDDLRARVIHPKRGLVVLVDEDLSSLRSPKMVSLPSLQQWSFCGLMLRSDQWMSSSLPIRMPDACGPQKSFPPLKVTMSKPTPGRSKPRREMNYPAIQGAQAQLRAARGMISIARTSYLPRTDLLWQTNRAVANNIYHLRLRTSGG